MKEGYKYTVDWFGSLDLERFLPLNTQDEIHILEIGSYEGKSTVWFIENLLSNPSSTITCIDPWQNYIQDENSFNQYGSNDKEACLVGDNKIRQTFDRNIENTGRANQVIPRQAYSYYILPEYNIGIKSFDIIFIDGNHTAPFVLTDAVLSWYLLKVGGLMIFDDYMWEAHKSETLRPQLSIDSFLKIFADYIEVIWIESRVIIKKTK